MRKIIANTNLGIANTHLCSPSSTIDMNSFPLDNGWNAEDPSAYVLWQNMRKVTVYKIPKGVDIDVQQIHGTHFGAPYIVDVNWSLEKSTHLSAIRK